MGRLGKVGRGESAIIAHREHDETGARREVADYGSFSAVYSRYPREASETAPCASAPFAIDYSFVAMDRAVTAYPSGRTSERPIRADTGGLTSGDPPVWLEASGLAEFVEFRPSAALRRSVAEELGVPEAADLADLHGFRDPVLWAASMRFRAHALGGWPLSRLEADALIEILTRRMITRFLGGRGARATRLGLDEQRLKRTVDLIEARLTDDIAIEDLADEAALSRYHFIRAFKATTGMTPHRFLLGRRMHLAKALIAEAGLPIGEIARRVGYADGHAFRRAFARFFGQAPGALRDSQSSQPR